MAAHFARAESALRACESALRALCGRGPSYVGYAAAAYA